MGQWWLFKYGDIGRMTEDDVPKLRAATEVMASALAAQRPNRTDVSAFPYVDLLLNS